MPRTTPPFRYPQYRHHRPRRRRQDDDDRAHPVLHGAQAHHHRHSRYQGSEDLDHHRLSGAGTEARHHHSERRGVGVLARQEDQPHRHPGPRRFHDRGEPIAARARRRRGGVRRRRRRRAAVGDQLASRRQLRRAAHLLRQQDGPQRRQFPALRGHDQEAPGRAAAAGADADRLGGQLQGHGRPGRDEGAGVGFGRQGRPVAGARGHAGSRGQAAHHRAERPRDPRRRAEVPHRAGRHLPRAGRRGHGGLSRRRHRAVGRRAAQRACARAR